MPMQEMTLEVRIPQVASYVVFAMHMRAGIAAIRRYLTKESLSCPSDDLLESVVQVETDSSLSKLVYRYEYNDDPYAGGTPEENLARKVQGTILKKELK